MPFLNARLLCFYDLRVKCISLTLLQLLESTSRDQNTQLIAVGYYWLQKTHEDEEEEEEEVSGHLIGR